MIGYLIILLLIILLLLIFAYQLGRSAGHADRQMDEQYQRVKKG